MKNAVLMLEESKQKLSNTEKNAAEYILSNTKAAAEMNIQELAQATFTSASTLYRMCRNMGFQGYKDFRRSLIYAMFLRDQNQSRESAEILRSDSMEDIIDKVSARNITAIEDSRHLIDPVTLMKCVELVQNAHTVLLFGIGASFCAAKDAHLKFLRINKPCNINEDWHSQLLMARNARPDDIGIVISYSGETKEIVECMDAMRENHTPIVAITRFTKTPVSKRADYKLYTAANEATFRSGAMSSRISQLNVIDILYTAYVNSRFDESQKQFSKTHINKTT